MKDESKALEQLRTILVSEGNLYLEYYPNPQGIEQLFSENVRKKGFPPNGIAEPNELECYYLVKNGQAVVGYFKAIDLYFDGIIELHSSYDGPSTFLIKSYFALSYKYIYHVCNTFPTKRIRTLVRKDNVEVLRYVQWLHFREDVICDDYIVFELDSLHYLSFIKRIINCLYRR